MARYIILTIILFSSQSIWAIDKDTSLFSYDKQKVEKELQELLNLERFIIENPQVGIEEIKKNYPGISEKINLSENCLYGITESASPGGFPSFWFTFLLSAVGTYFLYGAVAGPIAVGIVYFSSGKSKSETRKGLWGWIIGIFVGLGFWAITHL